MPIFEIIEEVDTEVADLTELETLWIKKMTQLGYEMLNSGNQRGSITKYHIEGIRLSALVIHNVKEFVKGTNITVEQFIETAAQEKIGILSEFLSNLKLK